MNKDVKIKIDELANEPYEHVKNLIDNPCTWEFKKNNIDYQGEIVAIWEDKAKGTIRLIGYETSKKAKWWSNFFSGSRYERIVEP